MWLSWSKISCSWLWAKCFGTTWKRGGWRFKIRTKICFLKMSGNSAKTENRFVVYNKIVYGHSQWTFERFYIDIWACSGSSFGEKLRMLLNWSQNTILGIILPKTHINGIKRLKLYYPYFLALTVSNLTWKPAIKESYDILESSWNACFRDLNRNYPHLKCELPRLSLGWLAWAHAQKRQKQGGVCL